MIDGCDLSGEKSGDGELGLVEVPFGLEEAWWREHTSTQSARQPGKSVAKGTKVRLKCPSARKKRVDGH